MTFLICLCWGLCLGLAFVGFGSLLVQALRLRDIGWPLSGAVGVSAFIALGGVLNWLHLVSPAILMILVLSGVARTVWLLTKNSRRLPPLPSSRRDQGLAIILLLLLLVPVLGNVHADVRSFSWYDDLPAYLTLPVETLQLHHLPADPFNERRVTSSLGAPYVLQAAMLVFGDAQSIRFVDLGIGTVLYAGLLFTIFGVLRLSRTQQLALCCCVFLVPLFRLNATPVALPAALFCCSFLLLIDPAFRIAGSFRQAVLLGLVVAALAALKSNYLPPAVLIGGLYYLSRAITERNGRTLLIKAGAICALTVFVCLLPWLLDMKRTEGTYLFPLGGRGFDASAYGVVPLPNGSHGTLTSGALWVWLTVLPMAGPLFLAVGTVILAYRQQRFDQAFFPALVAFLLGSALAILAIASSTGGESMGRYSLPFQAPALLIFAAFLLRWRVAATRHLWWWTPMAAVTGLMLLFLAVLFGIHHKQYRVFLEDARVVTPIPAAWFQPQREVDRVRALQSHLPPGEPLLARLFVTYPFDFRRNPIFVADYTGMAGLQPGMPLDGRPDSMARYLLSHGIRYLAYDYKRTMLPDDDPQTSVGSVLTDPARYGRHGWLYMQVKVSNWEQQTFEKIGQLTPHLYDDGTMFLVDLRDLGKPIAQFGESRKRSS